MLCLSLPCIYAYECFNCMEAFLVGSFACGKLFLWEALLVGSCFMGSFARGKCFVRLARGGVVVWAKSAIPMLLDRYLDGYVAP